MFGGLQSWILPLMLISHTWCAPHLHHKIPQKLYHGAPRDISARYSTILDKYLWEDDEGGYNFREDGGEGEVKENSLEEMPKPTKNPTVQKVELPWRKRRKFQEFDFFVLFVVVTGIPLMWTLGALLVTEYSASKRAQEVESTEEEEMTKKVMKGVKEGAKKKEEKEPPKEEKKLPIEQLNLIKEVLRVASQSYNLASNTVDLFNLIRGAPGIGGGGGDNGGDGGGGGSGGGERSGGSRREPSRITESITFVSKLLQLSTTTMFFILQILNY